MMMQTMMMEQMATILTEPMEWTWSSLRQSALLAEDRDGVTKLLHRVAEMTMRRSSKADSAAKRQLLLPKTASNQVARLTGRFKTPGEQIGVKMDLFVSLSLTRDMVFAV